MTPDKFKAIEARDADDYALADTLRQVAAVTDDKDLRATIDMIADRRALLEYVRELRKVMEHYGMETEHSCMCQFVNDTDTLASECYYHETIRKERDELRAELAALRADAELGRIALRFVDRAADYCEVDPAERICDQFSKAMGDEIERQWNARTHKAALAADAGAQEEEGNNGSR